MQVQLVMRGGNDNRLQEQKTQFDLANIREKIRFSAMNFEGPARPVLLNKSVKRGLPKLINIKPVTEHLHLFPICLKLVSPRFNGMADALQSTISGLFLRPLFSNGLQAVCPYFRTSCRCLPQ